MVISGRPKTYGVKDAIFDRPCLVAVGVIAPSAPHGLVEKRQVEGFQVRFQIRHHIRFAAFLNQLPPLLRCPPMAGTSNGWNFSHDSSSINE